MTKNRILLLISLALAVVLLIVVVLLDREPAVLPDTPAQTTQTTGPVDRASRLVGICLPSQADAWMAAGQQLKTQLEAAGYRVELACGDGTAEGQIALLETLLQRPVDCVIAAPVDSAALPETEQSAVPILAYGSLFMDTDAVSGYICYDYFQMGQAIAQHLEETLYLDTALGEGRSYTVELFMGAARDYNALLLYEGLFQVLEKHLNTGALQCKSNRIAFEDSCISGWSGVAAAKACAARLRNNYPDAPPDICICASDSIAGGVISSLTEAGISPDAWPMITGNGATEAGLTALEAGQQALTVRTDAAEPAAVCVAMVDRALFDIPPAFPVSEVFNNVITVPTALCGFELVTQSTQR